MTALTPLSFRAKSRNLQHQIIRDVSTSLDMTGPSYLILGLIGGAILIAIILLLFRRRTVTGDLLAKIELLPRAQDRGERMLREEVTRGREDKASAAKSELEVVSASLERV